MQNLLVQQRIRDLLEKKASMLGGGFMDYADMYGMGDGMYGMGEGMRKRRRRGPTAFNRKVSAYMRKHGVTLGEAAHALRGSGSGEGYRRKRRRPATYRRRRYGRGDGVYAGVLVGGRRKRTSGIPTELTIAKRRQELEDELEDLQEEADFCHSLAPPKTLAEAKIRARECGTLPSSRAKYNRKIALYNVLNPKHQLPLRMPPEKKKEG